MYSAEFIEVFRCKGTFYMIGIGLCCVMLVLSLFSRIYVSEGEAVNCVWIFIASTIALDRFQDSFIYALIS
jgi:hypothetical protein